MANRDNAGTMKRIIVVLIALLALSLLIPTMLGMKPLLIGSPKNMSVSDAPRYLGDPSYATLETTPSIAAFINNSWSPGVPYNYTQGAGATNAYSVYPTGPYGPSFLNNSSVEATPAAVSFMGANYTPTSMPVALGIYATGSGYKKHKMS